MFNKSNFCHIASNNRNEQKGTVFIYKTTDTLDQVTQDGYFNEKLIDINIHDLIICVHIDPVLRTLERSMLIVTERTLENVNTQIATEVGGGSGGEIDPAILDKINNLIIEINAQIDANAEAIQKTRDDYIAADSEIRQVLNNHESELTTLRGNQASLGDQVSGIEEKIPESASGTNHLVTKQMLLDKETDIRDDIAELEKKSGKTGKSLFDFKRTDYLLNDESWLHADTFSWQNGTRYSDAYGHLEADIEPARLLCTHVNSDGPGTYYIAWPIENAKIGDKIYVRPLDYAPSPTIFETDLVISSEITITDLGTGPIYSFTDQNGVFYSGSPSNGTYRYFLETETVSGITITYHQAKDGHKICFPDQESNLSALYESTGIAWYYLLDLANKQFKLPRTKEQCIKEVYNGSDGIVILSNGLVIQNKPNRSGSTWTPNMSLVDSTRPVGASAASYGNAYAGERTMYFGTEWTGEKFISHATTNGSGASGTLYGATLISYATDEQISDFLGRDFRSSFPDKYLYFYVGEFSQTATEQTAGLNAEMFNNKADVDLGNVPANYDYVIESQLPTADNGYTWYRKYKSNWVEQGGCTVTSSTAGNATSVVFAIPMADTSYSAVGSRVVRGTSGNGYQTAVAFSVYTTTGMKVHSGQASCTIAWQISGMAA